MSKDLPQPKSGGCRPRTPAAKPKPESVHARLSQNPRLSMDARLRAKPKPKPKCPRTNPKLISTPEAKHKSKPKRVFWKHRLI